MLQVVVMGLKVCKSRALALEKYWYQQACAVCGLRCCGWRLSVWPWGCQPSWRRYPSVLTMVSSHGLASVQCTPQIPVGIWQMFNCGCSDPDVDEFEIVRKSCIRNRDRLTGVQVLPVAILCTVRTLASTQFATRLRRKSLRQD